jgi:hypothetical protein
MSGRDALDSLLAAQDAPAPGGQTLAEAFEAVGLPAPREVPRLLGVVVGELIALSTEDRRPLVTFAGQLSPGALPARSTVDLHGPHIGCAVTLMFELGDPTRPIVTGVLRERAGWPLEEPPAQVQVEADGERLMVTAKEQLVLRCGKASITLTKAGKVLIEGNYLLSRSTGVNRIKGGSVQLN